MQEDLAIQRAKVVRRKFVGSKLLRNIWRYRTLYLMLAPGIIYYLIFKYMPMFGIIIAFKEYNITKGILKSPWADPWYKYFEVFVSSPYFSQLLTNTLLISFYKLIFGMIPPIILAILLNECRVSWFKRLIQTLSYMPHFLSWVIIYGILIALLSQDSGLFNRWIVEAGGKAIPFLTSESWFRSLLVSSDIWQNMGWGAIIYLAAIAGIDPSQYEAATMDGCKRIRLIWHVTLPNLRSIITILLILRLGSIMDAGFEQIYVLYNSYVYSVGDIIDTWVFRTGLEQLNFSLAASVGLFKSIIGCVLVLLSNRIAKKWGDGIW
ncbi:ABC transporter permease subunit [Paenibacillus qinlingensis]|uniref:ABC transporter permease n=1 Tax=Paenibacillus qinlingensis TaxID=1837343 RepID=UPI001564D6B5|nr:sugar ABC transporter permease [Paenibacillus qinlingensis]